MNWFLKGIGTSGIVFVMLAALFMTALPGERARGAVQGNTSARTKQVDELFNRNCARCHGADGRSDTPQGHLFNAPDFTDPNWWKKNSSVAGARSLRSIVARGKASMPGFGKKLTRAEINLLVNRIRSFRKLERKN